MRNAYNILVGNLERKRQLGRPRCRWEHNNEMDLTEEGWEFVDWMHLAQDKDHLSVLVNTVMNLLVP
jgi:hypothetical protein